MVNAINQTKIVCSPNILVINLNRGKGLMYNITINFGEYLEIRDYVYYKDANYIKYYQNDTGIKKLLKNTEFEYNSSIKFGLYVK